MTRLKLDRMKASLAHMRANSFGANRTMLEDMAEIAESALFALDELIPREFKVGDVVVRVTVMVIGRIVDFNDGIVDVKSGQGSTRFHLRDAEIRHATPEEIAVFEAWEKGK